MKPSKVLVALSLPSLLLAILFLAGTGYAHLDITKPTPPQVAPPQKLHYPAPFYREIVPTSERISQRWRYTTTPPPGDWFHANFRDAGWQESGGGFGTEETPNIGILGTRWSTSDIWLRRTFNPGNLGAEQIANLVFRDYHDEEVEIYINGVPAYAAQSYIIGYEFRGMSQRARQSIVPDAENVIAVHCHQSVGGQYIDVGIYERIPQPR